MPRHPLSATLRFKKLHDDAKLPARQSEEAAGFDLHAYLPAGKIGIPPGERKIVPCGFAMQLDSGYERDVSTSWRGLHVEGSRMGDDGLEILVRNLDATTCLLEPDTVIGTLVVRAVARISVVLEEGEDS